MQTYISIVIFTLCGLPSMVTGIDSVEKKLYIDLFTDYNNKLRPVAGNDYYSQVEVEVGFSIFNFEGMDESGEVFTCSGTMTIRWTDQLLQWNASDYNNARSIVVHAEDIWLPELTALDNVTQMTDMAFVNKEMRVRIFANGTVFWSPRVVWTTSCSLSVHKFPYDRQECQIRYSSLAYEAELVNFTVIEDVDTSSTDSGGEWKLTSATAFYEGIFSNGIENPSVSLLVEMKRNAWFFEVNLLAPIGFLSFMLIPLFLLPIDSGEKVSMGMTLMLTYAVFLLLITEYTPRSESTPHLSYAMVVATAVSTFGIFIVVALSGIHHHKPTSKVPKCVKCFITGVIGTRLCRMKFNKEQNLSKVVPECWVTSDGKELEDAATDGRPSQGKPNHLNGKETRTDDGEMSQSGFSAEEQKKKQKIEEKNNQEDWNNLAKVLDKIGLWVSIVYFFVFLTVMLTYRLYA